MKNLLKILIILILQFSIFNSTFGQFSTFDEIVCVKDASVSWADFNNDNFLDFIITGNISVDSLITKIYKNNGNGTFTDINAELIQVEMSSLACGDYNNDDFQDILLTGADENMNGISKIYKNNGDFTFTDINAGLTGVISGSTAWADFNNDGFIDILLSGWYAPGDISKIYKNNGNGTFTDINAGLIGVNSCSVAWGDYNNDGYQDIIITGNNDPEGNVSKIYKNNGNETFSEQIQINIEGVDASSATWADFNNDSFIDLLISGWSQINSCNVTELYINNGNETFSLQDNIFPDLNEAENIWLDYNNDGYLDVLLTGYNGIAKISVLYKNTGNSTFIEQTQINFQGITKGFLDCGDYNNDGYEDIIMTGSKQTDNIPFSSVYVNKEGDDFEKIDFTFPKVTKSHVSTADYNKDGYTDFLVFGINEKNLNIAELYKTTRNGFHKSNVAIPPLSEACSSWGDYNNDGYLDLLFCGKNNMGDPVSKIMTNGTNGNFSEAGIFITGVYNGTAEWMDYNNDGLLDFIIAGYTESNLITKIYKNTGTNFVETPIILPGSKHIDWSDYNNDGFWDLLLIDEDYKIIIFKNDGNEIFTEVFNYYYSNPLDFNFNDYNNDGFDDILILRQVGPQDSKLYYHKNLGNGTFIEPVELLLTNMCMNSSNYIYLTDFNFDGKSDVLINNTKYSAPKISIYYNDTSSLNNPDTISGTEDGSVVWANFDNDNDIDFFICGKILIDTIGKIFYNMDTLQNSVPSFPSNLSFTTNADTVFLSWNKAADNETPQNALTYNCYIYEIGGDTIWHSMSDKNTGKRYLQRAGNTGHNNSWYITGLEVGKHYRWSAQAIDNSFAGGPFAEEKELILAPGFIAQPENKIICENGSVTIRVITTGADSYQWQVDEGAEFVNILNEGVYNNATTSDLSISNVMLNMNDYKYRCAATTIGGTSYSEYAILTVDTLITANAGDDGSICVSTEYQLAAIDPTPAAGTWSCDVQQVSFNDINAPNAVVSNLPEGSVNLLWSVFQDNVCGMNSDIVVITQNPDGTLPEKSAKPDGETELCIGSTSNITTSGANNTISYNWEISPPEAGTISEIGTSVKANWSNNYSGFATVKVQAENECGTGAWSDDLVVELKDIQANDIIQKSETMLISVDSGYIYQWYHDEALISGANKQYYYNENMQIGNYQVKISFYEGCDKLSSIYELSGNNKSLTLSETVKIYPNPTTGKITIEIDNDLICKIKYTITDNLGRIRKESIINKKQTFIKFGEDISGLNVGNYHIEFIFNEKEKVGKQLIIK